MDKAIEPYETPLAVEKSVDEHEKKEKKNSEKEKREIRSKKKDDDERDLNFTEGQRIDEVNQTNRSIEHNGSDDFIVSSFDSSAESHFMAMDVISKLCGETDSDCAFDDDEIQRFASTVTFLSEWRQFNYRPRTIRFAVDPGASQGKGIPDEINLPQFSAVTVPTMHNTEVSDATTNSKSRKDFMLYAGGSVRALDWCPRLDQRPECDITCEFIAVSAHPPDSNYHKLGAPLSGRGMIQIWCLLNYSLNKEDTLGTLQHKVQFIKEDTLDSTRKRKQRSGENSDATKEENQWKKPRGRPRKTPVEETQPRKPKGRPRKTPIEETQPKKPKGRPRKIAVDKTPEIPDCEGQFVEALAVEFPESSSNIIPINEKSEGPPDPKKEMDGKIVSITNAEAMGSVHKRKGKGKSKTNNVADHDGLPLLAQDEEGLSLDSLRRDSVMQIDTVSGGPSAYDNPSEFGLAGKGVSETNAKPTTSRPKRKGKAKARSQNDPEDHDSPLLKQNKEGKTPVASLAENSLTQNDIPSGENLDDDCLPIISYLAKKKVSATKANPSTSGSKRKGKGKAGILNDTGGNDLQFVAQNDEPPGVASLQGNNLVQNDVASGGNVADGGCPDVGFDERVSAANVKPATSARKRKGKDKLMRQNVTHCNNVPLMTRNGEAEPPFSSLKESNLDQTEMVTEGNVAVDKQSDFGLAVYPIPKDLFLPRVVLCLGHDGKVAWDVKWRPVSASEPGCKSRMGYLAVVLGDGSIEVWEIPSHRMIKLIYSSRDGDGTDPRFVKLKPVMRCSMSKCSGRQSIPLTMEWSTSPPHDLILAGCHDGVVAMWKFSRSGSPEGCRPLLRFSADTVPIRALAWAPFDGESESTNVIVTAGHAGLRFWDLRDPFWPLWDIPMQRFIYSLDWLPDPRCIISSYDDGTLRILSLTKAACDVPVTGKPYAGTKEQGLQSCSCSPFAVWNVHVSRLTGLVAYCGADGTVLYFQLTHKAVDKDHLRNRAPHFLCGSLVDEKSGVAVKTGTPNAPHPMKRSATKWSDTPGPARHLLSRYTKKEAPSPTKSEHQVLALCYGNDPGNEDTDETEKSSNASRSKKDQSLINVDPNNTDSKGAVEAEMGTEIETFPSKTVAMHRVRWNMNKGSEKWLCYGGAAGVIRCQVIFPPVFDKKLLRK